MKKLTSLLFILMLSTFCFGQNDSEASQKTELKEESNSAAKVPKFSNADVQKFADEYAVFYNDMINAAKIGDEEKLNKISEQAVQWAQRSQEVTTKMTPEDMQQWADWAQQLAEGTAKQ